MTRRGKRAGRKTYITDAILFKARKEHRRDPMESSESEDEILIKPFVDTPCLDLMAFSDDAKADFKVDVAADMVTFKTHIVSGPAEQCRAMPSNAEPCRALPSAIN